MRDIACIFLMTLLLFLILDFYNFFVRNSVAISILSGLYQHYKALNPEKAKEIIRWSPVAWKFVNLIGNYEFYKKDKIFDIQEVIRLLIKNSKIDIRAESLSQ